MKKLFDFYDFLQSNEVGIDDENGIVQAWVHIHPDQIDELLSIVGWTIDDGVIDCKIKKSGAFIILDEILNKLEIELVDIKNVFNPADQLRYLED